MALDRFTHEKLAHFHIADHESLAEQLRTLERAAKERRQEEQSMGNRWFLQLLQPLAMGHILTLNTLRRL